jgi:hypothetical protein
MQSIEDRVIKALEEQIAALEQENATLEARSPKFTVACKCGETAIGFFNDPRFTGECACSDCRQALDHLQTLGAEVSSR